MKFRKRAPSAEVCRLQMSAMIDIVFLLLVFFVMTFRIVAQEGDLAIDGPATAGTSGTSEVIHVTVEADDAGKVAAIRVGGRSLESVEQLKEFMKELAADGSDVDAEASSVVLDCDDQLDYSHAVAIIEAVTGYKEVDGKTVTFKHQLSFAAPADN